MATLPFDTDGWTRGVRAGAASRLKQRRLEREAQRLRDEAQARLDRARRAQAEKAALQARAEQQWHDDQRRSAERARRGDLQAENILADMAHCERRRHQAIDAATATATARDAAQAQAHAAVLAQQRLATQRLRVQCADEALKRQEAGLACAREGLQELDAEEEAQQAGAGRAAGQGTTAGIGTSVSAVAPRRGD
jgi:hypothetical protein